MSNSSGWTVSELIAFWGVVVAALGFFSWLGWEFWKEFRAGPRLKTRIENYTVPTTGLGGFHLVTTNVGGATASIENVKVRLFQNGVEIPDIQFLLTGGKVGGELRLPPLALEQGTPWQVNIYPTSLPPVLKHTLKIVIEIAEGHRRKLYQYYPSTGYFLEMHRLWAAS